jgi:hypothetical protein
MLRIDNNGVPMIQSSIAMSLFGLGLVFVLALEPMELKSYFYPAVYAAYEDGSPAPSAWRLQAIVIGVARLSYVALAAATAFFFFQRRRVARTLVMWLLAAGFLVTIVETAWACWLADGDTEYVVRQVGPAVLPSVVACAWFAYFATSRRVRAVLVYPLAVDAQAPS